VALVPTLPPAAYLSDEIWRQERELIWFGQWVAVARTEDVERVGDRVLVDVAGESVIVVRGSGGLHAYYNVCKHRGAELVDRDGPACGSFGSVIRCPYHGWTYGLDGALRASPFVERPDGVDGQAIRLSELAVADWGGFVFVRDGVAGDELGSQLAGVVERLHRYPLAELRRGLTFRYDVAANWKVLAENYNECYHCAPVHPELCTLVPAFRRGGAGLEWPDGIPHREGAWTFTMTGTSARRPFPELDEHERTRHKGELIYPNLLLSLSAEHVAAFRLEPHGPGHTTVVCDLLFHPDEIASPSFDPSDAGDLWDLVNVQDWAICERVQRGMSSRGWTGGWFAPMEDESADITRWYARSMGDRR
jgi:phenylpropionate dioxygenase-like ring-hydroxylating dioxygenase large terminal subunit